MEEFLDFIPLNNDLEEGCEIVKVILKEVINENQMLMNQTIFPILQKTVQKIQKLRLEEEEFLDTEGLAFLVIAYPKLNLSKV